MQTDIIRRQGHPRQIYGTGKARTGVRDAYEEIISILKDVENDKGIQQGLLKRIYDREAAVVYLRSRERIHGDLMEMVSEAGDEEAQ